MIFTMGEPGFWPPFDQKLMRLPIVERQRNKEREKETQISVDVVRLISDWPAITRNIFSFNLSLNKGQHHLTQVLLCVLGISNKS